MTNQELIASLDIDQKTGKISLEQWSEMRGVIVKLIRDGAKRGAAEPESGYAKAEENCKGCMGPCGMCEDTVIRDARELEEIVRLGTEMRSAQKAYFRSRTSGDLAKSKMLEREFDARAAKKLDEEPTAATLFTSAANAYHKIRNETTREDVASITKALFE